MRRIFLSALVCILMLPINGAFANTRITSIIDGDTIKLSNGESVRLLQIDTPELRGGECYAKEAQQALAKLINRKGKVRFTTDPKLDEKDAYGRLLRYIFVGKVNINLRMIKVGAASPYFYRSELGMYSAQMLEAAKLAQERKLGLWNECPGTVLNPHRALSTQKDLIKNSNTACDVNYDGCIPTFPPDLNCDDIRRLGLAPVRVIGKDLHRLDADGDGIGCL